MRPYCYVIMAANKDWEPVQIISVCREDKLWDVLDRMGNHYSTKDGRIEDEGDGWYHVVYPTPYGYSNRFIVEKHIYFER